MCPSRPCYVLRVIRHVYTWCACLRLILYVNDARRRRCLVESIHRKILDRQFFKTKISPSFVARERKFFHLSKIRRRIDTRVFNDSTFQLLSLSFSLSLSRSHSFHIRNFSRTHAQIYSYARKVSLSLSLFLSSFVRDSRIDRIIPKTHEFCQGRFLLS